MSFDIKQDVLERFLRYVQMDTEADPDSETYPSSAKQLELLRLLAEELRGMGVADVRMDEYGYVMATLPSNLPQEHPHAVPTIGFLAHVDTAPDVTGANVRPQVIERYEGGVIQLPADPTQRIDPAESPELLKAVGHTLVTTDGTTLLGADDKAGVAEIMTAVRWLMAHPEVPHGPLAVAFTPDEEIGKGTAFFDLEAFGAKYAYTLDGGEAGGIEFETFSADGAKVTITGRSQHPGTAQGKMVNAVRLAAEFVARLPRERLSPETTSGYEGFIHPGSIEGEVEQATVQMILRDHDDAKLTEYRALVEGVAEELRQLEPRAEIRVTFHEQYRNMRNTLEGVWHIIEHAEEATRRVGLEPFSEPVRGGTDGSVLTTKGLPTPNLFTGGHDYHSRREWADVDTMAKSVEMLVALAQIWAERGEPNAEGA